MPFEELPPCACGCGATVREGSRYLRGHHMKVLSRTGELSAQRVENVNREGGGARARAKAERAAKALHAGEGVKVTTTEDDLGRLVDSSPPEQGRILCEVHGVYSPVTPGRPQPPPGMAAILCPLCRADRDLPPNVVEHKVVPTRGDVALAQHGYSLEVLEALDRWESRRGVRPGSIEEDEALARMDARREEEVRNDNAPVRAGTRVLLQRGDKLFVKVPGARGGQWIER